MIIATSSEPLAQSDEAEASGERGEKKGGVEGRDHDDLPFGECRPAAARGNRRKVDVVSNGARLTPSRRRRRQGHVPSQGFRRSPRGQHHDGRNRAYGAENREAAEGIGIAVLTCTRRSAGSVPVVRSRWDVRYMLFTRARLARDEKSVEPAPSSIPSGLARRKGCVRRLRPLYARPRSSDLLEVRVPTSPRASPPPRRSLTFGTSSMSAP